MAIFVVGCGNSEDGITDVPAGGNPALAWARPHTTDYDQATADQMVRLAEQAGASTRYEHYDRNCSDCGWREWPSARQEIAAGITCDDYFTGKTRHLTQFTYYFDQYTQDIAISFAGSQQDADGFTDLALTPGPWRLDRWTEGENAEHFPLSVHLGISCAYASVVDDLKSDIQQYVEENVDDPSSARIYFTGHSLGGSLSVLAGLDLSSWFVESLGYERENIVVHTFGANPVFTDALYRQYRNRVPNTWQIAEQRDPIPFLPGGLYTLTHNVVLLNTNEPDRTLDPGDWDWSDIARVRPEFTSGRKLAGLFDCEFEITPANHAMDLYVKRLDHWKDSDAISVDLQVAAGHMVLRWGLPTPGLCDRVALYRGNPEGSGEIVPLWGNVPVAGLGQGLVPTLVVPKGPRYFLGYHNRSDELIAVKKYSPPDPGRIRVDKSVGFLKVFWPGNIPDLGIHDFIAIYDDKPTGAKVSTWVQKIPSEVLAVKTQLTTAVPANIKDYWVAYVTAEVENRVSLALDPGAAKIMKVVKYDAR
jgi:hypothetical protein